MLYYKLLENGEMGGNGMEVFIGRQLYLIFMSKLLHMNCYIVAKT